MRVILCVWVGRGETGRVLFKWPPNHFIPVLQRRIISDLQRIICVIYTWGVFFFLQNLGPLLTLCLCPSFLSSVFLSLSLSSGTYVMLLTKAGRFTLVVEGERAGRIEGKWGIKGIDEQNFNEPSLMTDRSSVMITLLSFCRVVQESSIY